MSNIFTDEQIHEIIEILNRTKHTQYIGSRYVPLMGRKGSNTIEWDNKAPYEPLTIVLHNGNSYTSRQYVPTGIDINNNEYWANTGNYNAQIEQYRQEVATFNQRITDNKTTADNALSLAQTNKQNITLNDDDITAINNNLDALGANTVSKSTAINKQLQGLAPDKYAPNTHAIFIGDSITQGWNGSGGTDWTSRLCNKFKWTKHNYAVGGSGFNPANKDCFKAQTERAIADTTFNHNNVSYIFVSGGINDDAPSGDTRTACLNAAQDVCTMLKTNFPNAKIYSVIGLCARMDATMHSTATTPLAKRISYFNSLARVFITNNIPCVANAWRWLLTNHSYSNDGLHPNELGYNIIQGYYEEIIKNTYNDNTYETRVPEYNGVTKCSANIISLQIGIINTATTATIFGSVQYRKSATLPLAENDTISADGHTVDLYMCELPPNLRSTVDTYIPILCNVNGIVYYGYSQLKYVNEDKTEKLRIHLNIANYNFNTNDWSLTAYWNLTIPVYGISS